jgi:hypothetical protein
LYWLVEWILIGCIGVLVVFILRMVLFGSGSSGPRAPYKPKRKPAKIFLTPADLAGHDGSDASLPVFVAIRGAIFDVSSRRDMYGVKGQGYNVLAGRDASRALAKHALDEATCNNPNIDDLTKGELDALESWEGSFKQKYNVVGYVVADETEKAAKAAEEKLRYDRETKELEEKEKKEAQKAKM